MHFFPRPIILSAAALILAAAPCLAAPRQPKPKPTQPSGVPAPPPGFTIDVFARAPEIHSPASLCVTPTGEVFVGEDEYNSGGKIVAGTSRVKMCVDTDGDDEADRFTVFADKLNAPQGMTFVGDTLYVVHAPFLTALRDLDGDGVADTRRDLVTGLGPIPEGLVHHIPSGVRMGIDGWLYISIGDKGILKATGADGRTIQLHGGGVVRVRPDGSEIEVFSSHTRNTFDVSIDPLLDTFTRDNTNDGGGWASRLAQMQRDGAYGYPSLFKNYGDEIIQPLADYGGGSATGSMYIHEPGFPASFGDCLYTLDWAKGIVFRHDLRREGASYTVSHEELLKGSAPTDIDADGRSRIFLADWDRRSWGSTEGPVGSVYLLQPAQSVPPDFPPIKIASAPQLISYLTFPSAVRRLAAQQELLRRGDNEWVDNQLRRIVASRRELYARVAALFTLAQLQGPAAAATLGEFWRDASIREFALRALADRESIAKVANPNLFAASVDDVDPRVRLQAAIGIGHLGRAHLAERLIPRLADEDALVRHAAMQSLRRLDAVETCADALAHETSPRIRAGVLRTMRGLPAAGTVNAIGEFLARESDPILRQEAARALGRLYQLEAPWDGKWWTPRPETHGPNYASVPWPQTPLVADTLVKLFDDPVLDTARTAMTQAGLCAMAEAAPALAKRVADDNPLRVDAAHAVIQMKSAAPAALLAMQQIVASEAFDADTRSAAAAGLGGIDGPDAQAIVTELIAKLDRETNLPAGLLDKICDSLASRPADEKNVERLVALLNALQHGARVAAATTLLRSSEKTALDAVADAWQNNDPAQLEALFTAISRLPADSMGKHRNFAQQRAHDKREPVRHAAISALGHLADAAAVKELVAIASTESDRIPAASGLAEIPTDKIPDDQVQPVATLLVTSSSALARRGDQAAYGRILAAAQKILDDKRMPAEKKTALLAQMKQPGVITSYLRTDSLPGAAATVFPPENSPAGPFESFSVEDKSFAWKPMEVTDPRGIQKLDLKDNSVAYFAATHDAPTAGGGLLSCGSDDGIQVWINGKKIDDVQIDRGVKADMDKIPVTLQVGKNTLLFKVFNHSDGSGIQSRLRTRVAEFDAEDLVEVVQTFPGDPARGKSLFESVGCIKCHTIDPHEDPKGPYLGGAGSKYDGKYLAESVLRPSAKIAQGFGSEKIVAKDDAAGATEYLGFIARESAADVQLRDLTGRVSIVPKSRIVKRTTMSGSMMPDGLADALSLDDFASLLKFLQSLKEK